MRRKGDCKLSKVIAGTAGLLVSVAVLFMLLAVAPVIAEEAEVTVTVNAPECVEERESFDVTIDVEGITDFNIGAFDLSFDHDVVKVEMVTDGSIDGTEIPTTWDPMDSGTIKVILEIPGVTTVSGSGYLAKITFTVKGDEGDESALKLVNGELVKFVFEDDVPMAEEIPAEWFDGKVIIGLFGSIFDTGPDTYPSISGTHEGTIEVYYDDIVVEKLYTYPCVGTGGHTEYVRIWGNGIDESASWSDYTGDWHSIVFGDSFTLKAGKTYNYVIITGSYPQIHYTDELEVVDSGIIRCTKFTDANGREYNDRIPAIKLW